MFAKNYHMHWNAGRANIFCKCLIHIYIYIYIYIYILSCRLTWKLRIECTVVLKKAIAETSTKMVYFFMINNETMGLKIYLVITLYR